ncbi:MAG: hypothetical protein NTU88_11000 [Armatimonadetes bacterium]|nr:hypothetical protein [Armatimonadota bacterium]
MRLLVVLFLLVSAASAEAGNLAVTEAYYRDANASLHIFVANKGAEPVSVLAPVVNGFDTASLSRDGLHPGPVLWYRCRPNPFPPGGMADLLITLAEPTDKPAAVEIRTSSGERITRTIPCVPEPLMFQAIRFSRDLRSIDVYVRWSDASSSDALKTIRLDGRNMSRCASPRPARSLDGLAYMRITLDRPLVRGSFHVFEVETEAGLSTAYQIRAIPAEFIIGVYGIPSEENVKDWAAHGCNHYLSFGAVPPDLLDLMNASGITVGARYIPQPLVDRKTSGVVACDEEATRKILKDVIGKPILLYHHLVDEPDVSDYYAGKRLGASGMELIARAEFWGDQDPERYTFIQLDNTFRPRNYRVYGESADVLATHRYSLGSFLRSEAGSEIFTRLPFLEDLQETMTRFRQATEPNPFFMVPQFFNIGKGRLGREPTIGEMRLQCYVMVAGGARGLIHYIHSGSSGGHEGGRTKPLWDAMADMHAELKRVGEVVQTGTPAPQDWVKAGSPNVYASALLCGDRIAVILINRAHRSALDRFTALPMHNVPISVRIPPWIEASRLEVIPADGADSITPTACGDEVSFTVGEIKDARCFILCPKLR